MKILCSFSALMRFACWLAALCLVAGVAMGQDAHPAHVSPPTTAAAR